MFITLNYKYTSLTFGFSLLVVTVICRILCFVCTIQCKHNNIIIIKQFTSGYLLKIACTMHDCNYSNVVSSDDER